MSKNLFLLILIVIFIAMLAAGCSKVYTFIANGEYAVLHNERIYYSYSNGFFSMNTDGTDQQKLNDVFARHMHIVDNKIYFINSNYRGYIFSMNIDGTDLQQLNEEYVSGINIIDGWIYYMNSIYHNNSISIGNITSIGNQDGNNGTGICKMRTDGSERQLLINDKVNDFVVVGDIIYYSTWDGIFSIGINENNRQQLNDTFSWSVNVIGDWIFYIDSSNEKLHRIGIDGSNEQQLIGEKVRSIHIIGDRIYFEDGDNSKIYSIKPDGSDRRRLSSDNEVAWIEISRNMPLSQHPTEYSNIFIHKR